MLLFTENKPSKTFTSVKKLTFKQKMNIFLYREGTKPPWLYHEGFSGVQKCVFQMLPLGFQIGGQDSHSVNGFVGEGAVCRDSLAADIQF